MQAAGPGLVVAEMAPGRVIESELRFAQRRAAHRVLASGRAVNLRLVFGAEGMTEGGPGFGAALSHALVSRSCAVGHSDRRLSEVLFESAPFRGD